jgi:predicted transcriptional regulator
MQMARSAAQRVALMSIHPEYAEAILSGRKCVEFRKRPLAEDIDIVLIYATAPVQAIVGWFRVGGTVKSSPSQIWRWLHSRGEISRPEFETYYAGYTQSVALLVEGAERFSKSVRLSSLSPRPAIPQSFSYIPDSVFAQVKMIASMRSTRELVSYAGSGDRPAA